MNYKVNLNDKDRLVISKSNVEKLDIQRIDKRTYHLIHENKAYNILLDTYNPQNKSIVFFMNDIRYDVIIEDELDSLIASMGFNIKDVEIENELKSPMPGVILEILVVQGQEVNEGDQLMVLEAMKMENMLKAHGKGIITSVDVNVGEAVEKDQILISFE